MEFKISQTKTPDVIQTVALVLASKNVDIGVVSSNGTASSWSWHIFIKFTLPAFTF
jgi:hypothetical protein